MNEPEAIPDRDYTTQQAADLCGISINTLLSWERRHGVPHPRRNERGERVYGSDDIRQIRWLVTETARGTSIGEAIRLLKKAGISIQETVDDVVVAFDIAPGEALPSHAAAIAPSGVHGQRDLLAAIERLDRATISALLSRIARQSSPDLAAAEVVVPAVRTLARTVDSGEADPATLVLATRWLGARLTHWLDAVNPARQDAREVVVLVPHGGPLGGIVAITHALQLARHGCHVLDLDPGAPLETVVAVARTIDANRIDLIGGSERLRHALDNRATLLRDLLPTTVTVSVVESPITPGSPSIPILDYGETRDNISPD
ncbi:MAG: MerR family transcriptional regulator [Thermomicrobiales bacterium]